MSKAEDQAKEIGVRIQLERESSSDEENTENRSKIIHTRVVLIRNDATEINTYKEVRLWIEGVCFRFSRDFLNSLDKSLDAEPLKELLGIANHQLALCGDPTWISFSETEYEFASTVEKS